MKHKRTFYRRSGRKNKHHIRNRKFGDDVGESNILILDENRHAAWHLIFNNLDFVQAAKLLIRTNNIKKGTRMVVLDKT